MIRSGDYYEYQGCIHIHTSDSDGTKSVEEVAEIASAVNLDYILVADHMTLKSRLAGKEGFYKNTLILIGYEHNDEDDCNHYLLFETADVLPAEMKPHEYVAEGKRQGALGIIAHPDEIRPRLGRFPSYPWLAWDADGFDGIEIWNQMSEWMEKLKPYNWFKMIFTPRRFMRSPTDRILEKWDNLNQIGKIAGVGAIDVHAYPYKMGPLRITIFPYKVQFKSLRTHLLLSQELSGDLNTAKRQVYAAIKDCRAFVSNYRWGDASGFQFTASDGADKVISGGTLKSLKNAVLTVRTPQSATIRLLSDGRKLVEVEGSFVEFRPERNGVFRAEVYKKDRGWIFSNHIRVGM